MGLAHSPRTITDSLIFALDAANIKSYPGTGNIWFDMSRKNNHFYLRNAPTFQGTYFANDGTNDHYSTSGNPNNFAWTPNGAVGNSTITIDMWVRSSDTSGVFFTKPWNGSGQYNIFIYPTSFVLLCGTTSNSVTFGRTISNGTWTNIVCWANATDMGYYLNGIAFSSQKVHNITGDIPSAGNGNIECGLMTLYPYGEGWSGITGHNILGDIASCKMYSRVLTQNEVLQNFNAMRGRYGL